MDQLTLTPYLDSKRREVLASEITEEMAVRIRKWPLQTSAVYPGDYLILDHRGRMVVVSETMFVQNYTKPKTRNIRQKIHDRTWLVEIEINGKRSIERWVAPPNQNTHPDVLTHFHEMSDSIKVLSLNRE